MKKQSLTKLIMFVLILFVFNIVISSDIWAQEATPTATLTPVQTTTPAPTSTPTSVPTSTPTPTSEPSSSNQTTISPTTVITSTPSAKVGGDKKAVLGSSTKLGKTSSGKEIAKWGIASAMGFLVFLIGLKIRKIHVEE